MNLDHITSKQKHIRAYLKKTWHLRGHDLEDLTQDTLLVALENFHRHRALNGASLDTFILGMAKNVARQFIRRKMLRRKHFLGMPRILRANGPGFNDCLETQSLRKQLMLLPERYAKILDLIYYQGYKPQEVAHILQLPVGQVWSFKSDAIKSLRKKFLTT